MKGNPGAKTRFEWGGGGKSLLSTDELYVNLLDRALEFKVYLLELQLD